MLLLLFMTFLSAKTPVLLVPGIGGSQLQYRNYDWVSWEYLWTDSARIVPGLKDAYIKDVAVVYSPNDDSYGSSVKYTRPYSFGNVDGIDHVDDVLVEDSYYYHDLIQALEDAGYSNGADLVGAPFDFRVTSYRNALNTYFPDLQKLIEATVNANGNQPILAVSHSGGSTVFRHFLANYVTAEWKQQYIKGWVSGSGVFAGIPGAVHVLSSYKEFTDLISGEDINKVDSFFAGLFWMLPTKFAYSDDTLIVNVTLTDADSFVVTVGNISEAFSRGIGADHATAAQNTLANINSDFKSPEVELWLYYGTGKDTVVSEDFTGASGDWWKQDGSNGISTDGDGVLPTISALAPTQWETAYPLHLIEKPGEDHIGMASNADFINDIVALALNSTEHEVFSPNGLYAKRRQCMHDITAVAKDLQHAFRLRLKAINENIKKKMAIASVPSSSSVPVRVQQLGEEAHTALLRTIRPINQAVSSTEQALRAAVVDLLARYGTTQSLTATATAAAGAAAATARARAHAGADVVGADVGAHEVEHEGGGGSFAQPEGEDDRAAAVDAAAAAAAAALAERDGKFEVKATAHRRHVISVIRKAMKKATDIVDEMEKQMEALLLTSSP